MADDDDRHAPGTRDQGSGDAPGWTAENERVDELTERVAEEIRRSEEETVEEGEGGHGRVFTREQIVEEAAVMARSMYGQVKHSLDPAHYGERREDAGYYDLVDIWMVIGHRLDLRFHSRFLRRASYLKWGSRINRRMVPNYYLFAQQGVDKAIDEHYINPLFEHKMEYLLLVRWFLPLGPPIAYFDAFGPTHSEAAAHARFFEEGVRTAGGEQAEIQQKITYLESEIEHLADKFDRTKSRMEELEDRYKETGEEVWQERADDAAAELEELREDLEGLYAEYEELREEGG